MNRFDGSVVGTGTALPTEFYVRRYEYWLEKRESRWLLVVEAQGDKKDVILFLKARLELSMPEVARIKGIIPGPIMRGTRTEMAELRDMIAGAGFAVSIREVADAGQIDTQLPSPEPPAEFTKMPGWPPAQEP